VVGGHYYDYHQVGMDSQCKVGRGSQSEVEGKVEGKVVAELAWYYPLLDQVAFDWVHKVVASEHTLDWGDEFVPLPPDRKVVADCHQTCTQQQG